MLPSFFVVGPPRTGTSWLHEILKNHAVLPDCKETRFFDVHFDLGLGWYQTRFAKQKSSLPTGEIAPTYFASRAARERIKNLSPLAKIVCIFRNPAERLISLYRLKRAYAMIPWNFEEALLRDEELAETSMYATHLAEWLHIFGSQQVRAMFYDDLRDEPQNFVDELADFIEMPRFRLSKTEMRAVHSSDRLTQPRNYHSTRKAAQIAEWLKARRFGSLVAALKASPVGKLLLRGGARFAEVPPEAVAAVSDLLRDEIDRLEAMTGRDLAAWKQPADSQTSLVARGNSYQTTE